MENDLPREASEESRGSDAQTVAKSETVERINAGLTEKIVDGNEKEAEISNRRQI